MTKGSSVAKKLSIKRIAFAVLLTCAIVIVLLFASAALISREILPANLGRAYIIFSIIAGTTAGSSLLSSGVNEGKAIAALINAAMILVIILTTGLIIGKGSISASAIPYQLLCVALGSITGCILTARKRKKKRR